MSKFSKSHRRTLAIVVAAPLLLSLAACGEATVDSSEVTTSAEKRTTQTTSTSKTTTSTTAAENTVAEGSDDIVDPAATRASEAPSGQMPLSDVDEAYLDALIAADIDVEGVEDALIGTGHAHCLFQVGDEPNVMVNAIAGQLIAQDRTDAKAPDVARAIAKAAEKAYC